MAEKKGLSTRGKLIAGVAVLLVAAGIALGTLFPNCSGLGLGGGEGEGEQAKEAKDDTEEPSQKVEVVVQGAQCRRGGAEPVDCATVCSEIKGMGARAMVEVDATEGAHNAVEDFKACLKEAGVKNVNVFSR